jgi:hypothetical protein
MSFTTKVRATGELFDVTTDLGTDEKTFRDAHPPLEPTKLYSGHLFVGSLVGSSQYVEYSEAKTATFHGSELDEEYGDIRLAPVR